MKCGVVSLCFLWGFDVLCCDCVAEGTLSPVAVPAAASGAVLFSDPVVCAGVWLVTGASPGAVAIGAVCVVAGAAAELPISLCGSGDVLPSLQLVEIIFTSRMLSVDWPLEFEAVSELAASPVISISWFTCSANFEVSPVSWKMRPSSAFNVKLPLPSCRHPRTPLPAFAAPAALGSPD